MYNLQFKPASHLHLRQALPHAITRPFAERHKRDALLARWLSIRRLLAVVHVRFRWHFQPPLGFEFHRLVPVVMGVLYGEKTGAHHHIGGHEVWANLCRALGHPVQQQNK